MTREEQKLMFSNMVYCYSKFKKLPHEVILWMKEVDPEYAEGLSRVYGELLATLSIETMKAGIPDSCTDHLAPDREKRLK